MARPAGLPCPSCEGMQAAAWMLDPRHALRCKCGSELRVIETREDPDNDLDACVWRLRECERGHPMATVQFRAAGVEGVGVRVHRCRDCGASFSSVERQVSEAEARERLAALARERVMLARAGRRAS